MIVAAQFAGTSLWFVGNAVLGDLAHLWTGIDGAVGWITSSVQLGFIVGTLVFALSGLADRVRAHHLFFASAIAGAGANAASLLQPESFAWFLSTRFVAGFFLAGVYPVGMKLAASWYREGLGSAIGWLVGALVLGTALPHLLRTAELNAFALTLSASGLAVAGGLAIFFVVPEGPNVARAQRSSVRSAIGVFGEPGFRRAALGYFGHMWELYAFWAFVPFAMRLASPTASAESIAFLSFVVIGAGSVGCLLGGRVSIGRGSAAVARFMLTGSGVCALASPAVIAWAPFGVQIAFFVVWGALVVGDSPQFSAVAANNAPPQRVGTALTLMNAIGFALTIPSIQLLTFIQPRVEAPWLFATLIPGPILGILAFRRAGSPPG